MNVDYSGPFVKKNFITIGKYTNKLEHQAFQSKGISLIFLLMPSLFFQVHYRILFGFSI